MKTKILVSVAILAAVILAASMVLGRGLAQEYSGQKWEYRYETFSLLTASSGLGAAANQAAGVETPTGIPNTSDAITARLNEFGVEGWELVSSDLLIGGASPAFMWIFKRPAE